MIEFELTEDHLELLARMWVRYDDYTEFGAPEIDPKRPYGNSDVYSDMAEILKLEYNREYPDKEVQEKLLKLHKECQTALQIVLRTQSFETGIYIADKYTQNWRKK